MNIFNQIFSFLRRARSRARFDPVHDWLLLLIGAIAVLIAIVIWNVWAFGVITGGSASSAASISTQPVFNQSSLDAVHTLFKNRADAEMKYVTGVYRYTDPSL